MARFVFWPSKTPVPNHVLRLSAREAKKFDDKVAVAECGTDLDISLVNHAGSPATGTATLDDKLRKGDLCPVRMENVAHGDRIRVLQKGTGKSYSTDLNIIVEHAPAKGGSLSATATPDTIVDNETTPADVTFFFEIELNVGLTAKQQVAVPMTAVYVPDRKKLTAPYNILWWFHGHKKHGGIDIQEYLHDSDFTLREFIQASSKRNFLLVAPTLGDKSDFGLLNDSASAANYLEEVLNGVHKQIGGTGARPNVGQIVLAGHSGAYRVMERILGIAALSKLIKEVWCFDCMYAGGDVMLNWATSAGHTLDRLWAFSTGSFTTMKDVLTDPKRPAGPDNPTVKKPVRGGTGDQTDVFLEAANARGLTNIEAYDKGNGKDTGGFKAKYGVAPGHNESVGFYFTKLVNSSKVLT
jgi:hypothetical protein